MPRFLRRSSAKKQADKPPAKGRGKQAIKQTARNSYQGNGGELGNQGLENPTPFRPLLAGPSPENKNTKSVDVFKRSSQLSKGLLEVLTDDAVLQYFMEFMQKQGARALLTFWLAAETFRIATVSRYRAGSTSRLKSKSKCNGTETDVNGTETSSAGCAPTQPAEGAASQDVNCSDSNCTKTNPGGPFVRTDNDKSSNRANDQPDGTVASTTVKTNGVKGIQNDKQTLLETARQSSSQIADEWSSDLDEGLPSPGVEYRLSNGGDAACSHASYPCSISQGDSNQLKLTNGIDSCGIEDNPKTLNNQLLNTTKCENDTDDEKTSLLSTTARNSDKTKCDNEQIDPGCVVVNEDDDDEELVLKNEPPIPRTSSGSRVTFDLSHDGEDHVRDIQRHRTRSVVIDAVSIYSKYVSLQASHPIDLEEELRRKIEMNICTEDGRIHPDCFGDAQAFAFNIMNQRYFPTFQRSHYYCKHQIDILTSGKVFLSDVLYNDTAMFYFMEYLEMEGARHLLEFWLTADSLSQDLKTKVRDGRYQADEALQDAMIVYDKYFSMQAPCPLGVDDCVRIEIENRICQETGPSPECFDIVLEHCLALLEMVYFPSFLQSEIYYRYLTELLNSVSENEPSGPAEDDCSSTTSDSVRLTSFDSDWDLSDNPDSLWHRPNAGALSLGRVNEFGVYQPLFEPEPDTEKSLSAAAKLSKAMRKLVSNGADKAKEEMAWKIAGMILDDVKRQLDCSDVVTEQQLDS